MRALRVTTEDGPGAVTVEDLPEPDADLVVAVRAAGVSFPDLLMTRGEYQVRQELPFTLGGEAAGEVVRAPAGGPFAVGDRVVTLSYGAHAERVAAVPEATFPLPDELSFEEGAALPLNYLTALAALERRGRLQAGETVLVHGAAGGVGTACVQVAKALGASVVAVVSTEAKAEVARAAGADAVAVGEDFRGQLAAPVQLVVDPVGGQERFLESLRALAPEGRLVVVGFTSGEIPEVRVNRLLLRNVDVCGCSFGVLALDAAGTTHAGERLAELVRAGAIKPLVGSVRPLEQAAEALRELDERRATGKVVLTPLRSTIGRMPDRLYFTDSDEANALIASDPMALLIGFALDQQVPVQKAFMGPYVLRERLGSIDAATLAEADLEPIFRERPAIHRFPGAMAERVHDLAVHVRDRYAGDAARVWTDAADADALRANLAGLPGYGEMKVKALGSVLAKRFGVAAAQDLVPWHPTLGDVDSPQALADYQAAKRVHKAEWSKARAAV